VITYQDFKSENASLLAGDAAMTFICLCYTL